jgi:hypothetical protein
MSRPGPARPPAPGGASVSAAAAADRLVSWARGGAGPTGSRLGRAGAGTAGCAPPPAQSIRYKPACIDCAFLQLLELRTVRGAGCAPPRVLGGARRRSLPARRCASRTGPGHEPPQCVRWTKPGPNRAGRASPLGLARVIGARRRGRGRGPGWRRRSWRGPGGSGRGGRAGGPAARRRWRVAGRVAESTGKEKRGAVRWRER